MKIIVIGSRAYNELVGRIEKIEAAIASLPEKGRAWNKEYINDEWMDGEQVCRYLGISGRTLQRLRSDHVITYSAINRKLYYSLTEIRRVLKECVEKEDKAHPLTDDELARILKEKGFAIARRTVAKYREQLGIPVARLRK